MTRLQVTRDLAEEPGRPLGKEALGEWQTDEERRNLGARGGRGGDMGVAAAAAAVRGGPAGGETPRHQAASSRPGQCRGGSLGLAKLLTACPVLRMYLDESGDHSLRVVDPAYPVFVLAGVVIDETYVRHVVRPELDELEQAFFGDARIVLHTSDLVRNRNGFERMKDPAFRGRFLEALNAAMCRWSYTVVACAIRKADHVREYGTSAIDPYMLSLEVVAERFCYELRQRGAVGATIIAEARGQSLDRILERSWQDVLVSGTRYVGRRELADRVRLELRTKRAGEVGLELADLVVSPIGRHVIGKPPREDWVIVSEKLRRRDGTWRGAGLVVLPR